VIIAFQIHYWRKYCGSCTDIIARKTNDSYCYFLSQEIKEKGARGSSQKIFKLIPFLSSGNALFDIERAFHLLKGARVQTPRTP